MKFSYPEKLYASVLLVEGKIFNWKVGYNKWDSPAQVKMRMSDFIKRKGSIKTETTEFIASSDAEHDIIFRHKSKEWMKQWEIHPDYKGIHPFDHSDEPLDMPF